MKIMLQVKVTLSPKFSLFKAHKAFFYDSIIAKSAECKMNQKQKKKHQVVALIYRQFDYCLEVCYSMFFYPILAPVLPTSSNEC